MTYVIVEACIGVKDRACVDVCPVDCIYEGADMLYIHPDECIDCGACEPACPVKAIYNADDLPVNLVAWTAVNADKTAAGGLQHITVSQDPRARAEAKKARLGL